MASRFTEATRSRLKLRMALDGPSGSGKSVTALRFAYRLAAGGRIFAVNTEAGGLQLYAGETFDDDGPLRFAQCNLTTFAPTEFTAAINEAGREGAAVILVDSLSHAWEGKDGALDQVDKKKGSGNSFTAWKDVTPQHRAMIEAILQSPAHVICTMRSKTEYVMEQNDKGQQVPRRIGVAPVQRAGMEYEFDLYVSMDWSHLMTVMKSRCRAVDGALAVKPGGRWIEPVIAWLEVGNNTAAPVENAAASRFASGQQVEEIANLSAFVGEPVSSDKFKKELIKRFSVQEVADLRPDQAGELIIRLKQRADKKKPKADPKADPHATVVINRAASTQAPTEAVHNNASANGHAAPAKPQPVADAQLDAIVDWFKELASRGLTREQFKESLHNRYGVGSIEALTRQQADELIERLKTKALAERQTAGERF